MEGRMRVRIIRSFVTAGRGYQAGTVEDVDPQEAIPWAKSGLVMQDKSLDGAKETKAETIAPPPPPGKTLPADIATQAPERPKRKRKAKK